MDERLRFVARLMRESNRPASEIATELGVRRNQLYKWTGQLDEQGDLAFRGRGHPKKKTQSEIASLRQENDRLREEVEILKRPPRTLRKT